MKQLIISLAAILLTMSTFAQSKMDLARQAVDKDDQSAAIQYTTDHLKQNPKDAEALAIRAAAFASKGDYESALADISAAIKYWNKKCPITLGKLYCLRGYIYEYNEQYQSAMEDYNLAIKKDRKNPVGYESRAKLYYEQKMYAEAEADFRKAYELDPKDTDSYIEVARCLLQQDKNEDAVAILDKIIKYEPMQAEALRLRAVAAYYDDDMAKFIELYVSYLSLEHGDIDILLRAASSEYAQVLKAVSEKVKSAKNDDNLFFWLGVRARTYQVKEQYDEALADLHMMKSLLPDSVTNVFVEYYRAVCYYEMYEYSSAAKCYTELIKDEKRYFPAEYYLRRGACYDNLGNYDQAISDFTKVIAEDMDYAAIAYLSRGETKDKTKDYEGALEDYNKGLLLDESNIGLHMYRGRLLLLQKQDTLRANADFDYILSVDTTPRSSVRHYALLYTGKFDEAIEWMNKVLDAEPSAGNYYDAACLYARMNRPDDAMRYLRTSLNMGYRNLVHLEADSDLDSLRNRQDYKDLIAKYKKEKISGLFNKL